MKNQFMANRMRLREYQSNKQPCEYSEVTGIKEDKGNLSIPDLNLSNIPVDCYPVPSGFKWRPDFGSFITYVSNLSEEKRRSMGLLPEFQHQS